MRARSTVMLLLGFLLAIVQVSTASGADEPSLQLTPPTVAAGVPFSIDATFTASGSQFVVAQCRAGTDFTNLFEAGSRCAIIGQGNASGLDLHTTAEVDWWFTPFLGGERVFCDIEACELAVGIGFGSIPLGTISEVVATPLDIFAEIRGSTSYRPGDAALIAATVFGSADRVDAVQCLLAWPASACIVGTEFVSGATHAQVTIQRFLEDGDGVVDCIATPVCGIGLRVTRDGDETIHFLRPLEVLPPTVFGGGRISDIPLQGAMTATGMHERSWGATIWQCVDSLIAEPFEPTDACAETDASPNPGFSTSYTGNATVVRLLDIAGVEYDCASVDCVLALSSWRSPAQEALQEVYIEELPYRPMVHITTDFVISGGYRIGERVRFFADTYHPDGGTWEYSQCVGTPTLETRDTLCEPAVPIGPDSQGNGGFIFQPVKSVITTPAGDRRCGRNGCTAMVTYTLPGGDSDYLLRPIELRQQTLFTPIQDLQDGDAVHVEEIGVIPTASGAAGWVMQCGVIRTNGPPRLGCGHLGTAENDHAGHFTGSINVATSFTANGYPVHCGPGNPCAIAIVVIGPGLRVLGSTATLISFAELPP